MVEAVVEYDYTALEPDELTIRKGDVIREIIKKQGGWWEGTLRDKRGMFPDNFVTVIQKENKVSLRAKPTRLRQCRAIFSYHPAHDDELKLSVGDVIDILCEVEEGWWKGRLGNYEGVFPSNFVAELDSTKAKTSSREDLTNISTDQHTPSLPPKPTRIICQAKYPYDACNDDELTLKEGDLISLISKDGQDRGWWRGELRGRIGVFPDNFVTVLPVDQNGPQHGKDKKQDGNISTKMSHGTNDDGTPVVRPTNIASQRKSLEQKTDGPPLPLKKPNVPKKSPSSTSSGALAGLKQKLVDKVDGAASSRCVGPKPEDGGDTDFDQVERSAMLPDMRANRVKAPGRRPPSVVYRESEPNLVNGNSNHTHAQPAIHSELLIDENDDKKDKMREWEKHKAPWVDELKLLNQGKRTPPLETTRLKLTPTADKTDVDDPKTKSPLVPDESSPVDMTKSMSALNPKLKTTMTPDLEKTTNQVPLRNKQPITTTPIRPQSIHGVMVTNLSESKPVQKPPVAEKNIDAKIISSPRTSIDKKIEVVTMKQYHELQERLVQMEGKMLHQFQEMQSTIEDLKSKLQVETDMRRLLQAELEKVAQCVTQV